MDNVNDFNPWLIIWESREMFLYGVSMTLILFFIAITLSFIFGGFIVLIFEYRNRGLNKVIQLGINIMRMMPFLLLVYLIYYGLPQAGIQLSAWTAGIFSLVIYHGAYFAELFRGARVLLPVGSIESARAYGYTTGKMYFRIILPQILMRSRPLMGNQLIYCLKDTAFLCIITVKELTAVANEIQGFKFIPFQAFITVIMIYWILCLGIEQLVKLLAVFGRARGIENA